MDINHSPHRPRKRFGQNFLQDAFVIQKIIEKINPKVEDRIVEIGPGLGALTIPLLPLVNHLDVIEIDRELVSTLALHFKSLQKLSIHTADALTFDFNALYLRDPARRKLRIIGNLPYNISTPLMFHLLQYSNIIEDMYFMLQKEVVDRLAAKPNHKDYGRLSLMTQYFCEIQSLLTVSPNAFQPRPKVQSAVIRLIPHTIFRNPANNFGLLQTIVRITFNLRRKTLANSLKLYLNTEDFIALNIDPIRRPETLSLADFVKISNYIDAHYPKISENDE